MAQPNYAIVRGLAIVIVSAGCARGAQQSEPRMSPVPSSMVVYAEELGRILHPSSLMDALQRLRPAMLQSRGRSPMVSIDGSPPAELAVLGSISVSTVREVRLVRSAGAVGHAGVTANGDIVVGDLILVTTLGTSR
jgi:hypothetical protein